MTLLRATSRDASAVFSRDVRESWSADTDGTSSTPQIADRYDATTPAWLPDTARHVVEQAAAQYRANPTDDTLLALFVAYVAVGQNPVEWLAQMQRNESVMAARAPADPLFPPTRFDIGAPTTERLLLDLHDELALATVTQLQHENAIVEMQLRAFAQSLTAHLDTAQRQHPDAQRDHLHRAELALWTGNTERLDRELFLAHLAFAGLDAPTPAQRRREITALHRLCTLAGRDLEARTEWLAQSTRQIDALAQAHDPQWVLLQLEHATLRAALQEDLVLREWHSGLITDLPVLFARIQFGYEQIIAFGTEQLALGNGHARITDALIRSQCARLLRDAHLQLLGHQLHALHTLRVSDALDRDTTMQRAAEAWRTMQQALAQTGAELPVAATDAPESPQADAAYVYASFLFREGAIGQSLDHLRSIARDFPQSAAADRLFASDGWPARYGIVTTQRTFAAALNTPSSLAALKTLVAALDDREARMWASCGVGAGLFIAADLIAGEKASGLSVLGMCLAGIAAERTVLGFEMWDDATDAYTHGASNADLREAAHSAVRFAAGLGSVAVAGAAGRLAHEAVLRAGLELKGQALQWVIRRGALAGPWERPTTGFVLREMVAYPAQALVTAKTWGALQHAMAPAGATAQRTNTGDATPDFWATYLFVRFLPFFHGRANVGQHLVDGASAASRAARFGINSALAAFALEGFQTIMTDREGSYGARVSRLFRNMVALQAGGAAGGAVTRAVGQSFGLTEPAPPPAPPARTLRERAQQAREFVGRPETDFWFLRRATQEVLHTYDLAKAMLLFSGMFALRIFHAADASAATPPAPAAHPALPALRALEAKSVFAENHAADATGGLRPWITDRGRAIRDTWQEWRDMPWSQLRERPDADQQALFLQAAKMQTAPWARRGTYRDDALDAAAARLQANPKGDSILFSPPVAKNPASPTFSNDLKDTMTAVNRVLDWAPRTAGRVIMETATTVGHLHPRYQGSRRVRMAQKDLMRETHRPTMTDPIPWFDVLLNAARGAERAARARTAKAEQNDLMKVARQSGDTTGLSPIRKILFFANQFAMPLFETAHVGAMYYALGDLLFTNPAAENEDQFLGYVDTLPGAVAFVLGSNYVAHMSGITTLGGGLIAQLVKTITWGTLVSMEGANPLTYFANKPRDIGTLQVDYLATMLANVMLFSGLHSSPGNPVYAVLTNLPGFRAIPSMTRFFTQYTRNSPMVHPNFIGTGRLVSMGYVGTYYALSTILFSRDEFMEASPYYVAHRMLKTVHLGLWLKPLGAKLNQAGTLGQLVERVLGYFIDLAHGLVVPVKAGKGSYAPRLHDALLAPEYQPPTTLKDRARDALLELLSANEHRPVALVTHEIFRKATQSLDLVGSLGNLMAQHDGYGSPDWKPRAGWRTEIVGVKKHVALMEQIIGENPEAAVRDAQSLATALTDPPAAGVDLQDRRDQTALVIRTMQQKMWANHGGDTAGPFAPYRAQGSALHGTARTFWDALPAPATPDALYRHVQEINDGRLDVETMTNPLH